MLARCPINPKHRRFHTTAQVQELWEVDARGIYQKTAESLDVTHKPDPRNTWRCVACGVEAQVEVSDDG